MPQRNLVFCELITHHTYTYVLSAHIAHPLNVSKFAMNAIARCTQNITEFDYVTKSIAHNTHTRTHNWHTPKDIQHMHLYQLYSIHIFSVRVTKSENVYFYWLH